jgi:uncharacterized protein (TIGR02996 family)
MRTFVFKAGTSDKFWNIQLQGGSYTVTFGRSGTAGRAQTKTFADAAKAQAAHDKIVAEKLKEGYVETTAAAAAPTPALQEKLEAAIREDPDNPAPFAALADWLIEQGDPRGEFIQVQLALEDQGRSPSERKKLKQREEELLGAHRQEWVGSWEGLAPSTGPEGRAQMEFRSPKCGFVRGLLAVVTIDTLNVQCARALIRSTQTRFVRELYLGGWAYEEPNEYEAGRDVQEEDTAYPSRSVFPRWPYFANLRVFQLGWTSDESYADSCYFQCHLSGDVVHDLVKRMPHLEELYLFADRVDTAKLFALKTLHHLRVLQVYHCWHYPLERLARNPALGRLTHLLLHPKAGGAWTDAPAPYITFDGVRAILQSRHLTSLTHLRLRLTDLGDPGCEEFVRSGILRRLKMLDLRHGVITDAGARILAACPDVANLEVLDLSRNRLTAQGIAALRAINPRVLTDYQQDTEQAREYYLSEGDYE